MIYVALLRGINVGGNNKIDMKLLRKSFENAGMERVSTYINSGNILFSYKICPKSEISKLLEDAILKDFSLNIKVLIRDFTEMKSDVMFLWDEVDDSAIMERFIIKPIPPPQMIGPVN